MHCYGCERQYFVPQEIHVSKLIEFPVRNSMRAWFCSPDSSGCLSSLEKLILCIQQCKSCKASKQHQQYEQPQCGPLHCSRTVATVSISLKQPRRYPSTFQHQKQECGAIRRRPKNRNQLSLSAYQICWIQHLADAPIPTGLWNRSLLNNASEEFPYVCPSYKRGWTASRYPKL